MRRFDGQTMGNERRMQRTGEQIYRKYVRTNGCYVLDKVLNAFRRSPATSPAHVNCLKYAQMAPSYRLPLPTASCKTRKSVVFCFMDCCRFEHLPQAVTRRCVKARQRQFTILK